MNIKIAIFAVCLCLVSPGFSEDGSGTKTGRLHRKFTRGMKDVTTEGANRLSFEQSLKKLKEYDLLTTVETFRVISVFSSKLKNPEKIPVEEVDKFIEKLQSEEDILDPKLLPAVKKYTYALTKIKNIPKWEKEGHSLEKINSEIRRVILSARNSELAAAGKPPIKKFWKLFLPKQSDQGNKPDCVATSLHMLLRYYRIPVVSPAKLAERINIQRHLGTTAENVEKYLDERKIPHNSYSSSITDLKEKISTGNPVMVFQIFSIEEPFGHARLAVGFDDQKGVVYVIDPNFGNKKFEISYDDFELLWLPHKFGAIVLKR